MQTFRMSSSFIEDFLSTLPRRGLQEVGYILPGVKTKFLISGHVSMHTVIFCVR